MKNCFAAALILFLSIPALAEHLEDLYRVGLQSTARVKNRVLDEASSAAQKSEIYATLLPRIDLSSIHTYRDEVDNGGSTTISRAFTETYQHNAQLSLNQPLFRGGSEFASLSIAKDLPRQAKLATATEKILYYNDLAQGFYSVLLRQREIALLESQIKVLERQVAELRRRTRIGRSRLSESLSAESQLARQRADLFLNKNLLTQDEQRLRVLAGQDKLPELEDPVQVENLTVPDSWSGRIEENPSIQGLNLSIKQAEREISAERGQYYPNVDLNGNYYLERSGVLSGSDWDVNIALTWNLYEGGGTSARVQQQRIEVSKLENTKTDLKRNLTAEFQSLSSDFKSRRDQIKSLKNSLEIARRSFQAQQREFNQGLVSNLEFLNASDELLMAERAFETAQIELKLTWHRLRALVGELP